MKMAIRLTAILFSVFFAASALAAESAATPKLDIGKGASDASVQCVEDPKIMRKVHMNYLMHQRDETVHKGIRGSKYSLAGCVDCHASLKDNSVLGSSDHFCQGCHEYAAVKLDCFECHTSKRKVTAEVSK
ncbi:MAG TPA: hypothetical protein VIU93_08100 [Gallionellaceae bacterium]